MYDSDHEEPKHSPHEKRIYVDVLFFKTRHNETEAITKQDGEQRKEFPLKENGVDV